MSEQDLYSSRSDLVRVARPAPTQPAPRSGSLATIIARIEDAIETETTAIRTDVTFDLKSSNARKSRYLYELNRALRDTRAADLEAQREAILRLRVKLAANEAAIRAHLSAVGEVAAMLRDAIQRSEADGTYTTNAFGGSRAP